MTALLVCLLLSAPADDIKFMPLGTELQLKLDGELEAVRYFRLPEYKQLVQMDFDLQDTSERLRIYKDLDLKYKNVLEQKDTIIQGLRSDIEVKDARIERVEGLWHAAEKKAIENAGGPIWPYVVGAVGAAVGLVGAGLFLGTQLDKN
jgi:hypothetical protein